MIAASSESDVASENAALTIGEVVQRAFDARRFTAAVVRVERRGAVVYERAWGATADPSDEPLARTIAVDTRFDLASLTKLFVASAALRAVSAGALELDDSLANVLIEWRDDLRATITLRMLLSHTGGLQSGADYRTLLGDDVAHFALRRELVAAPGERVVYSDLGFIALGIALERLYSRSLSTIVEECARAFGATAFVYGPRGRERDVIPATECDAWRGRVRGFVHDEKAYLLGGVAGHAGGFGSALDVARLTEGYLAFACGREPMMPPAFSAPPLPRHLAREALREWGADPVLRRGLGWALKTIDENSCGALMSPATFGHTGFVGTCAWADPVRDLSVTLLTNAVYYGRGDLRDVRAAVCDASIASYG